MDEGYHMKILIADDHVMIRRIIKQILVRNYPFATIGEADNGHSLVSKATSDEWDIVISDISMPGMDGLDALREIKKHSPTLPVLILSNYSEEVYVRRALKAGATGYVYKGMIHEELGSGVRKIMAGRNYVSPLYF